MALSSHKHAFEMNCGPACTFAVFLLGAYLSARQPCARICTLRYPLIDCDSYPSPRPLHRPSSSLLGIKKTFPWSLLGVTLVDSSSQSPGIPNHASCILTETFSHQEPQLDNSHFVTARVPQRRFTVAAAGIYHNELPNQAVGR